MPSTYPTEDGYWPIVVIEGLPLGQGEVPLPRCKLYNEPDAGPLPVLDYRQLARLLGLALAQVALTAISKEEALGAEHSRGIIGMLLDEAQKSATEVVDGHYAGEVTHTMGFNEEGA